MKQIIKGFKKMDKKSQTKIFKKALEDKDALLIQKLVRNGFRWTMRIGRKECSLNSKELNLFRNMLDTIPFEVNYFPYLERLDLSNNHIAKINNLNYLSNLNCLILSGNRICKIDGLNKLDKLKTLHLNSNKISKIENLEKLASLEQLKLAQNQISKIEGLESLSKLKTLALGKNRISKLENLWSLKKLEEFSINNNQVKVLEGLELPDNLKFVIFHENEINEIGDFRNNSKIISGTLYGNPSEKISEEAYHLILRLTSTDERKNFLDKVGLDKLLRYFDEVIISKRNNYELINLKIDEDDYRPFLKMDNPSTGEYHIEGVQPDCQTVDEALAWRDDEDIYHKPDILT